MERFLKLLVEYRGMLTAMFHQLIDELKKKLPELGVKTAVDSKAIPFFGNPVRDEEKLEIQDGRRDTDADCPSGQSLRSFLRMTDSKYLFPCHPEEAQGPSRGASDGGFGVRVATGFCCRCGLIE